MKCKFNKQVQFKKFLLIFLHLPEFSIIAEALVPLLEKLK